MDSSLPINQGIVNKNYDQTGFYSICACRHTQTSCAYLIPRACIVHACTFTLHACIPCNVLAMYNLRTGPDQRTGPQYKLRT